MIDTPARGFYRYLLLCGWAPEKIESEFGQHSLLLPPRFREYHDKQKEWAVGLLGYGDHSVPSALRRAGMQDMLSANKGRKTGFDCTAAFQLLSVGLLRKPMEMLLLAGYENQEIVDRINGTVIHQFTITRGVVEAFKKYFFDPSILTSSAKKYIAIHDPNLGVAINALWPDAIEFKAGVRGKSGQTVSERLKDTIFYELLLRIENAPMRTDPESIKALTSSSTVLKYAEVRRETNQALAKIVAMTRKESGNEEWDIQE